MTVKAIHENGVLRPTTPLPLKEGEEVELEIKSKTSSAIDDDPTGWKTAEELIGVIKEELEPDAVVNHDRYIYRRDR